jgi:hypothetical protein
VKQTNTYCGAGDNSVGIISNPSDSNVNNVVTGTGVICIIGFVIYLSYRETKIDVDKDDKGNSK